MRLVMCVLAHAHHEVIAADADGHVAADEEGDAAEHLPLDQVGARADVTANPIGKLGVEGHGHEYRAWQHGSPSPS